MTVSRTRVLVAVLALALVAALVAVVLLWRDRDDAEDRAGLVDASVAAEKAAVEAVTRMTTYGYRTAEEDFGWVEDAATEKFQKNFDAAEAVRSLKSLRATAEGTVVESAADAADADHVKVLLFVDQRIRAPGTPGFKTEQTRLTVQMVREHGAWLVDEVALDNLLAPDAR